MHYAAIHVNRPSGISQAAAICIAIKRTQGVKYTILNFEGILFDTSRAVFL